MRFAYLCCDFGVDPSGTSGSAAHVRETVRALRELGHEVTVFSAGAASGSNGVTHVPLTGFALDAMRLLEGEQLAERKHLAREWRSLMYSEQVQRTLVSALEQSRPDVIYERYALLSYAGIELANRLGVPLLLEVNAPLWNEQATHRTLVLQHLAAQIEHRVLTAADSVVVVSNALARHARRLGVRPERISVLPNAVDPNRFHPGIAGEPARRAHGLEGALVAGFVGSMKPWHDIQTLLVADRMLADETPAVNWLLVGDGPQRPADPGPGARMIWTGVVPHEWVPGLMAAMDLVVVPCAPGEDDYFSPLKLFEAMAMALPIVAARVGQAAECIREGENGLLYEPGNAADLAGKIRQVFAMPDLGAHLGAAARQAVVTERTWASNARQIESLARSLKAARVAQ